MSREHLEELYQLQMKERTTRELAPVEEARLYWLLRLMHLAKNA